MPSRSELSAEEGALAGQRRTGQPGPCLDGGGRRRHLRRPRQPGPRHRRASSSHGDGTSSRGGQDGGDLRAVPKQVGRRGVRRGHHQLAGGRWAGRRASPQPRRRGHEPGEQSWWRQSRAPSHASVRRETEGEGAGRGGGRRGVGAPPPVAGTLTRAPEPGVRATGRGGGSDGERSHATSGCRTTGGAVPPQEQRRGEGAA